MSCQVSRDRDPRLVWVSTNLALGDRNKMFERNLAQMSLSSPPANKITSPGTERRKTGQIQQEKGPAPQGGSRSLGKEAWRRDQAGAPGSLVCWVSHV